MKSVAVVLNTPNDIANICESDIVCADGGYKHLKNQKPIALIGDFDTLENIPENVNILRYPPEKDKTDGQLCIDYCNKQGYDKISIYGAIGGRIDHVLGNIGLLAYAKDLGLNATIIEPSLQIELKDISFTDEVVKGCRISFYPFGGDTLVKTSTGLYYPYDNLLLSPGTSRGLSNVATDKKISLEIVYGKLLYIKYFNK